MWVLKNINISDILAAKDAFDRIDDNRFVRKAKKFHAGSIGEVFSSIKNAINPSYWGRKAVTNVSKKVALNKIARLIIKIVGNGSAMVYSKHLFNTDENSINNESDAIVIDANNDID